MTIRLSESNYRKLHHLCVTQAAASGELVSHTRGVNFLIERLPDPPRGAPRLEPKRAAKRAAK